MALECGQVIALRRNAAALIFSVGATHVTVVPIGGYNGPPPHRAEVRVDDPAEVFACGVSYRYPVVRCHMAYLMTFKVADAATLIGAAPASLMTRISRSITREIAALKTEAKLHFNDTRGSTESRLIFA